MRTDIYSGYYIGRDTGSTLLRVVDVPTLSVMNIHIVTKILNSINFLPRHSSTTVTRAGKDHAMPQSVSVSARYCIPQYARLVAGVCTWQISKKEIDRAVDKSKIKYKRKVKTKDKSWVK